MAGVDAAEAEALPGPSSLAASHSLDFGSGSLVDFVIDVSNGEISDLVIAFGNNLDVSRVSYPSKDGNVYIPSTDVSSFGQVILLKI